RGEIRRQIPGRPRPRREAEAPEVDEQHVKAGVGEVAADGEPAAEVGAELVADDDAPRAAAELGGVDALAVRRAQPDRARAEAVVRRAALAGDGRSGRGRRERER